MDEVGGPCMEAVVHLEQGKAQNSPNHGENDDVHDRFLSHEAAKNEHPHERQRTADQGQLREKLLVKVQNVDLPPRGVGTWKGQGAKGKNDDGRAD